MTAWITGAIAAIVLLNGPSAIAGADNTSGQYVLTQPRHAAKTSRPEKPAPKQKAPRPYNPKELTIEQSVPWQKGK